MDTYSVAEVAWQLGTSGPRVRRAIQALNILPQPSARGDRLSGDDVRRLVERLGSVPPGWTRPREDALVLAALNRRPLGLRSERAVARAARISPTAAGRAIDRLVADGLVSVERVRTVEGRAVDVDIFVVNRRSPEWPGLAAMVRVVQLPNRTGAARAPVRVPHRLWHLFWNADPATITLPRDRRYVASRLLQSTDSQAIAWSAANLDAESIRSAARIRGLDVPHRRLLNLLAQDAHREPTAVPG
ncbi:hypothetical protein BH24ACT5_BH24ACT5_26490 [soil metagenome]